MHRHRLSLLATVVILAVASIGYADTISINIAIDGHDVVTAIVNNDSGVINTSSSTAPLGGTDANGNPISVTTFMFQSPLDLTGWQGSTTLLWNTSETGAESGATTLFQLLPGGFSVTPDNAPLVLGTPVPLTDNWLTYVAQLGGSSGVNVRASDVNDVPEPNTLLLLGAGFLSVPWLRVRFRKRGR